MYTLEQNKLIKEFLIKGWVLLVGNEQTYEKATRNWHDGKTKRLHTEYFSFFYSVIFINKLSVVKVSRNTVPGPRRNKKSVPGPQMSEFSPERLIQVRSGALKHSPFRQA